MKETVESVDKLQADLDDANATRLAFENRANTAKDQVAILQCQSRSCSLKLRRIKLSLVKPLNKTKKRWGPLKI